MRNTAITLLFVSLLAACGKSEPVKTELATQPDAMSATTAEQDNPLVKKSDDAVILGDLESFKSSLGFKVMETDPSGVYYRAYFSDNRNESVNLTVIGFDVISAKLRLFDEASKFNAPIQLQMTDKFLGIFGDDVKKLSAKYNAYLQGKDKITPLTPQVYKTKKYQITFLQDSKSDTFRHVIVDRVK